MLGTLHRRAIDSLIAETLPMRAPGKSTRCWSRHPASRDRSQPGCPNGARRSPPRRYHQGFDGESHRVPIGGWGGACRPMARPRVVRDQIPLRLQRAAQARFVRAEVRAERLATARRSCETKTRALRVSFEPTSKVRRANAIHSPGARLVQVGTTMSRC